ncbi:MAG: carbamoyltransferase HypF [Planctomycetaceae bacterium]|nr:carbamoyltransferase HypF [Planctomycetaceae bacterium]
MTPQLPQLDPPNVERTDSGDCDGIRLILSGRVQGNGFRPRLARFAVKNGWCGFCRNTDRGIEVELFADSLTQSRLLEELNAEFSEGFEVLCVASLSLPVENVPERFQILDSTGHAPCRVSVPLDVGICQECLEEVNDPENRRHNYWLTTCATCGPRYSVMSGIPFDRARTTLAPFQLCPDCSSEYGDSDNRRFHAQTIACPQCGPRFWCEDNRGTPIETEDVLAPALQILRDGGIVALRGVGGYQLLADATNESAVVRLRELKLRPEKPFAVLCDSPEMAETVSHLNELELETLQSPANPIVLVRRRSPASLADSVSNGLSTVGVMLPTTAIHWELSRSFGKPLVATSGNIEGEALATTPAEAKLRLGAIADLFLHHNREITHPIDDSVVRIIADRVVTLRAARGIAPLRIGSSSSPPIVALGGHQKNAIALSNGAQSVLAPHVGDLDSLATRESWQERLDAIVSLYGVKDPLWVTDRHPDYYPSLFAAKEKRESFRVWHHHAHVVTGMLEHNWLDREVLGIAFDGTGLGPDGTIWGGEFLKATVNEFTRVGSLRPFTLVGSEQATRELSRSLLGVLSQLDDVPWEFISERLNIDPNRFRMLLRIIESFETSRTSSCGRLFDAASALILGLNEVHSEGIGPMRLESICDETSDEVYPFEVSEESIFEIDWRPAFQSLLKDLQKGVSPSIMASRFHNGLARAVVELARHFGLPVVLGGGVFQNQYFVESIASRWSRSGPPLGLPGRFPPNDGGLAVGQLAIAAAQINTLS